MSAGGRRPVSRRVGTPVTFKFGEVIMESPLRLVDGLSHFTLLALAALIGGGGGHPADTRSDGYGRT
jgi:hypothetical protein